MVCALCLLALSGSAVAQEGRLLLKLGGEMDTNARRVTGDSTRMDGVIRLFLKGRLAATHEVLGGLELKLLLGAKAFARTGDQDAIATALNLRYFRNLARGDAGALNVYAYGDLRDRSESTSTRDYLRGGVSAGLLWSLAPISLSVGGGYHTFIYKPDLGSNHGGGRLESALRFTEGAWGASLSYAMLERDFGVARFVRIGELVALDPGVLREDLLHVLRLGGTWRGESTLISAAYGVQINSSNSYGPGLVRHSGDVAWTQSVWSSLVFHLQGSIQWTFFDDPVRLDETLQIDDENRNQLQLSVSYAFTESLGAELRYALYTQAFGDDASFLRQLVFLGMSVSVE